MEVGRAVKEAVGTPDGRGWWPGGGEPQGWREMHRLGLRSDDKTQRTCYYSA